MSARGSARGRALLNRLPAGLLGQGVRYVVAGCIVMLVYLLGTLALANVAGLPFQLALAIGFGLAIVVHFSLQRYFVWARREEAFALPIHHQVARYLLAAAVQYGVTAASVALLPAALGLPTDVVYVATVMLVTSTNFLLFRHGIFQAASPASSAVAKPAA